MEDGTGEAQLYVYDSIVPTALKLTGEEWRHLQDLAMRTGELLYQRHWHSGSRHQQVHVDCTRFIPYFFTSKQLPSAFLAPKIVLLNIHGYTFLII